MNILYFLPSKQTFFLLPYSVTFYKHCSRFPPSLCDNRTRLQAPAQLWKEVTANKLTLCFIGLTSQQTLSRHAALAVSLTPVCLNISSRLPRSVIIVVAWQRAGADRRAHSHKGCREYGFEPLIAHDWLKQDYRIREREYEHSSSV